ncbi:hypothetical protein AB9P05_11995 [Roseivirga sp. BDSF3-8]|uniref:hypothetical protein n=1 Tax=Roseivirga sp. BDSF3-8 TaxID=3241598 RepID=UPI003531EACC
MKKNRLRLSELKVSSFISVPANLRGGIERDIANDSPLCGPTYWEGCEQTH